MCRHRAVLTMNEDRRGATISLTADRSTLENTLSSLMWLLSVLRNGLDSGAGMKVSGPSAVS